MTNDMAYWKYVIVKDSETNYSLYEAYFNNEDNIVGLTNTPLITDISAENIKDTLNQALKDVTNSTIYDRPEWMDNREVCDLLPSDATINNIELTDNTITIHYMHNNEECTAEFDVSIITKEHTDIGRITIVEINENTYEIIEWIYGNESIDYTIEKLT